MSASDDRRVALFATCMVDTLYPEVAESAVRLLERHGCEVVFPEGQTCCGQPAYNAGYRDEARAVAARCVDVFAPLVERGEIDAVVVPSGSCAAMVRHGFAALIPASDSAARERAGRLAKVTYELTEYLVDILAVRATGAGRAGRVTYHPCCHLLRELGVDRQPRALLGGVRGADVVPLPHAEECCGFGGLFALKNAPISTAMGRRKLAHLAACGAERMALCDVSCMTHLNGLLWAEGREPRIVHIARLLDPEAEDR